MKLSFDGSHELQHLLQLQPGVPEENENVLLQLGSMSNDLEQCTPLRMRKLNESTLVYVFIL